MISGTMVPRAIASIPDEVRQRRVLVETWAKASQEFCDVCYHSLSIELQAEGKADNKVSTVISSASPIEERNGLP
jgi:hypothetical protein